MCSERTSGEHDEGVLQEAVGALPVLLPLLLLRLVLLAEVEVTQRRRERKVGQLGQVPVLLRHTRGRTQTHTHTHTVFCFEVSHRMIHMIHMNANKHSQGKSLVPAP